MLGFQKEAGRSPSLWTEWKTRGVRPWQQKTLGGPEVEGQADGHGQNLTPYRQQLGPSTVRKHMVSAHPQKNGVAIICWHNRERRIVLSILKNRKWEAQSGLVIRRWVWFSSTKPNRAGPEGAADSRSHSEGWIPQGLPGLLSKTAFEFKQTNQQKPQGMQLSTWVLAEQGQSPKLILQHWTVNQSIS